MLDPAASRIMLRKLALGDGNRVRIGVEQDGTRRRRPLIDRQDVIRSPHERTIGSAASPRKGFSFVGGPLIGTHMSTVAALEFTVNAADAGDGFRIEVR